MSLDGQGDQGTQHQGLIGQRVEEGTRAGRALTPGDVAVEPVAGRQDEPHREVEPGGPPDDDHGHKDRGSQQARNGHCVGGRGQRAGPEGRRAPRVGVAHPPALTA